MWDLQHSICRLSYTNHPDRVGPISERSWCSWLQVILWFGVATSSPADHFPFYLCKGTASFPAQGGAVRHTQKSLFPESTSERTSEPLCCCMKRETCKMCTIWTNEKSNKKCDFWPNQIWSPVLLRGRWQTLWIGINKCWTNLDFTSFSSWLKENWLFILGVALSLLV